VRLTPLDIRKQEFRRVMRGLDQEEVEAFLSMVADEFETLIREKNQLNDDVLKLRTQLRDYQHVEHTLRETLVSARQNVEQSKANSQKQAEMILREADLKAEQIIEDAKEELMELRNEIRLLKSQKDSFAKRLRYLIESQLELISALEIDESDLGEYQKAVNPKIQGRISRLQGRIEREPQAKRIQEKQERFSEQQQPEPRVVSANNDINRTAQPQYGPLEFETLEENGSRPFPSDDSEHSKDNQRISNQFII